MDPAVVEQLRSAVRAFNDGDTGPLATLLHDDVDWRGVPHGYLWWKRVPELHGRQEARDVLVYEWMSRRDAGLRVEQADYEQVNGKLVASSRLCDGYGQGRVDVFQVLTFRDGRIVDVQMCRTRREAVRFAESH